MISPTVPESEHLASGFITVDRDWIVTACNHKAALILGIAEESIIGRHCREIFYDDPRFRSVCAQLEPLTRGQGSQNLELVLANPLTGGNNAVRLRVVTIPGRSGDIVGAIIGFADLTEPLAASRLALNSITEGVMTVDKDFRLTSFNQAAEKITGWREDEVLGQCCREIFKASICRSTCAIQDCIRVKSSISNRIASIESRDGRSIPIKINAAPLLDMNENVIGGVETFVDITSSLQHELILDSVADGVFTVDRDWRITSFNLSAQLITGWPREEALGSYCSDVFCSSICGKNCAVAESLYTGRAVTSRSITIKNRSGKDLSIGISAAPLVDHEGNVLGGVETFRDLSVEKNLRLQLTRKYTFEELISKSPAMQRIFQIMPDIAKSESNVLILGESGTGKELVASALFHASSRSGRPFVVVNCGALPDTLLESELFGYKAGAFTDARRDKLGRFAAAEGGTIFLDEIGDIPQALQVKLLRVLQHRVYEPLGSNTPVKADVRIIAATNKELLELVRQGAFRDDLYYRLNVVNILLPPLRDRLEDIPLLVEHFVDKFRAEKQKDIVGVSEEVITLFMRYQFPGNIRELENIIEYGFILCPGGYIQPQHLPDAFVEKVDAEHPLPVAKGFSLAEIEHSAIEQALWRNKWKKMKTCRELGISKDTLRRKIGQYGIVPPAGVQL